MVQTTVGEALCSLDLCHLSIFHSGYSTLSAINKVCVAGDELATESSKGVRSCRSLHNLQGSTKNKLYTTAEAAIAH